MGTWLLVAGVAVATLVVFGLVAWYLGDRLSTARRERVSRTTTLVVLVAVIGGAIALAVVLSVDHLSALAFGMILGVGVILLIELLAVPERLRSPILR